jgi:hypothetical protein
VNPLEAAVLIAGFALVLHRVVQSQLERLCDPAYLRRQGVVVVVEDVLQSHSAAIGSYMGRSIWGSVTFMGLEYRFDHVLSPLGKERLAPGELYLEPGLLYVTGQARRPVVAGA